MSYPRWTATYSNEAFDRAQSLAQKLADEDRLNGRPAPAHGYSKENFARAEQIVERANRYSPQCPDDDYERPKPAKEREESP